MATVTYRIPENQAKAGHLALARRLGLDPAMIDRYGFTVTTGDTDDGMAKITWTGIAVLPAQEAFDLLMNPPPGD